MKAFLSSAIVIIALFVLVVPGVAEGTPPDTRVIHYNVLRTANNPGYYFSGALIRMGVTLKAGAVDKDTFSARARVTEHDGSVQGRFGNFGWDPLKASAALGDGWATWSIRDAYVSDEHGTRVDAGQYVKIDIEWATRTVASGASGADRFDVPATRAAWYTASFGPGASFIAYASVELVLRQEKAIPGIAGVSYVQGETLHDPIFRTFTIAEAPGGGTYALYTPARASANNKRPILVWFHGTGERYHGANPGGNLVGNRALSFADQAFQKALEGAYVLAPQSTTAGWRGARLADMEALIAEVVAKNHVDPARIYVGGLSMGTGMTTPLITSTTEHRIAFAAAILCSGGNIDAAGAQIIAGKGFPVYLVGNASDRAATNLPASLQNLLAAGVAAKLKLYPEGPVFDGTNYFGAHDSWNYIYNNLVADDAGETIFAWLAKQSRAKTPSGR